MVVIEVVDLERYPLGAAVRAAVGERREHVGAQLLAATAAYPPR